MNDGCKLAQLEVDGLHNQFDVNINFNSDLNIIYGKNGKGKTTILHLIANLLEFDFDRFSYIKFNKIRLTNFSGNSIEILRDKKEDDYKVIFDGHLVFNKKTGWIGGDDSSMRGCFGGRAVYLPAFRSILERTRLESDHYYRVNASRESDYSEIYEKELKNSKDVYGDVGIFDAKEEAALIAEKTKLCRQWFGNFVPVIRYPSIYDVGSSLTDEWRRAKIKVSNQEKQMFESTFYTIFEYLLRDSSARKKGGVTADKIENRDVDVAIRKILRNKDREIKLNMFHERHNSTNKEYESNIKSYLLGLYEGALSSRDEQRKEAFQSISDFEDSINKFLDGKKIKIGVDDVAKMRSKSVLEVIADSGHSYNLSALSSGERQILTMIFSARKNRKSSGIFLIDEPELSLHIDWQRIILQEIRNQSPDRQIIVCTHSPEVGADNFISTQDFDPKIAKYEQESIFDAGDF